MTGTTGLNFNQSDEFILPSQTCVFGDLAFPVESKQIIFSRGRLRTRIQTLNAPNDEPLTREHLLQLEIDMRHITNIMCIPKEEEKGAVALIFCITDFAILRLSRTVDNLRHLESSLVAPSRRYLVFDILLNWRVHGDELVKVLQYCEAFFNFRATKRTAAGVPKLPGPFVAFVPLRVVNALIKDSKMVLEQTEASAASTPFSLLMFKKKPELPTNNTINYVHKIGPHVFKFTEKELKMCDDNCWLNDDIIDYYLCLLHLKIPSSETRERVQIFPVYFYSSLIRKNGARTKNISQVVRTNFEGQLSNFVTNLPDILSKDYLIFPIVRDAHWFLAVIVNPGAAISCAQDEPTTTTKKSYMIVFDSLLAINPSRHSDTFDHLTMFLSNFFETRRKSVNSSSGEYNRALVQLIIPNDMTQQANADDCGVFLLKFADLFLQRLPKIDGPPDFSSWWSSFSISGYRSIIRKALVTPDKELINNTSPKKKEPVVSGLEASDDED